MGEFKVDHATIAFRLALAEASEQEQARADALRAFWQRPVFAATWPGPNQAPRTLTNSHGETALPLFTGLDTLELGADRFSWREPNGSIRFREMSAREALRYALARQVNFVVVDVGFEHNVEFAREELEPLVLESEAQERVSARLPPPSAAGPTPSAASSTRAVAVSPTVSDAQPPRQSAQASISPQAARPQSSRILPEQAVQVRGTGSQSPQPPKHRSEPAQPSPPANASPPRYRSEQPAAAPQQGYAQASQSPPAPRHRSEQPGHYSHRSEPAAYAQAAVAQSSKPAHTPLRAAARALPQQSARAQAEPSRARGPSSAPPASGASDSMAPKHPSSVPPNLPLGTPIHDVTASPRLQSGAVPIQQPAQHATQEATPRQRSGAVPIQTPPSVRPEALEDSPPTPPPPPVATDPARSQRSISVPARRRTISGSPPPPSAFPPLPSETASTIPPQRDERPTASPPPRAAATQAQVPDQTHPQASFVPRPHAHTTPIHTPKAPTPAPQPPRAAGEFRRTPPPVPEAAKSKTPSTPGVHAPISDAPFSARPANDNKPPDMRRRARDDEPTLAERPNRANTQRGLQTSVPDAALEALSSELRGFPEVEWACVLMDESDVPLIGVRVDPSFLNRVADITDVIMDVGERQSVALQVLLLNNQDQVKNARRNGRAFYPWTTVTR